MRVLTKRFDTYRIGKYEKENKLSIMQLLDIGNIEINKIALLIYLGNSDMNNIEQAYKRLDDYLASDENNSILTAYFDLLTEFDKDFKIFKGTGHDVEEIKGKFKEQVEKNINTLDDTGE